MRSAVLLLPAIFSLTLAPRAAGESSLDPLCVGQSIDLVDKQGKKWSFDLSPLKGVKLVSPEVADVGVFELSLCSDVPVTLDFCGEGPPDPPTSGIALFCQTTDEAKIIATSQGISANNYHLQDVDNGILGPMMSVKNVDTLRSQVPVNVRCF